MIRELASSAGDPIEQQLLMEPDLPADVDTGDDPTFRQIV